jgi:hypothetical protein
VHLRQDRRPDLRARRRRQRRLTPPTPTDAVSS